MPISEPIFDFRPEWKRSQAEPSQAENPSARAIARLGFITTKVRSCYHVSILSNQAAKNFYITSKNNNKLSLSNLAIYIKKAVLKLKK
jgi:hypothetical protein